MVTIYCIEDINDLKYVGSTTRPLNIRLTQHRSDKRRQKYYTSSKLNLEYCIIYSLEECDEENKKQREQYWIDEIDCVNEKNTIIDYEQYWINYRKNNKEKIKERNKLRYIK